MKKIIWTIGHSTRTFEDFYRLLKDHNISQLIDVRRFPGSRKWPQFNKEIFEKLLNDREIAYTHMENLGGRRKGNPASQNVAWKNPSFRAYADYAETASFQQALEKLKTLAMERQSAIMCSEAVWWRCHRSIISDYLAVNGWKVLHILSKSNIQQHQYTSAAMVSDGKLNYRGIFGG